MATPPYLDARMVMSLVSWPAAIEAIAAARTAGVRGPPRMSLPAPGGEVLVMPAADSRFAGVKLVGIAPGNPSSGLPRIQAVYVLFDGATLTPRAVIDGTALTTLRTPAQSGLAVRELAPEDASSLLVFGSGPQAWGHVEAIRSVRPIRTVTIVGRRHDRAAALASRLTVEATVGTADDVRTADLVACATTARDPLFDGNLLTDHACVVAVGSHEPEARELDATVFARAARVVVEDRATALREAGDVIQAAAAGALSVDELVDLAALPDLPRPNGITVFKSVGMAWQDLAVAEAAYVAWQARGDPASSGDR